MFFAPKNKLDILFQGSLFVAYKDNHNIKKVDMSINSNISLNWVKTMNLVQEFEKVEGRLQKVLALEPNNRAANCMMADVLAKLNKLEIAGPFQVKCSTQN